MKAQKLMQKKSFRNKRNIEKRHQNLHTFFAAAWMASFTNDVHQSQKLQLSLVKPVGCSKLNELRVSIKIPLFMIHSLLAC